MITNYKNMATRYRLAYAQCFDSLPGWKQIAIKEDAVSGKHTRLNDELDKAVASMAEDESIELKDTTAPIVKSPKLTKSVTQTASN